LKKSAELISLLLLFSYLLNAQDINIPDWAWKSPLSKVYPTGEYYNLPLARDNVDYQNPNTTTRLVNENGQSFIIPPNVRPYPHTATQSEVETANMKGNNNLIYALWNSYGPSWWGTGFAISVNGGATWYGNYRTFLPNNGDPGAWVWPSGCPWAGRLGASVIQYAGYSTNNGFTWTFATNFPGATGFDKNLSAVDDITGSPFYGRAYTVWTDFGGPNIYRINISYSTDGGVSWSNESPVSPPPDSGHHNMGCDIEVGSGGVVYVVWAHSINNGQNSTEDHLGFAKSTNGGVNWTVSNNNVVDINGVRTVNMFNEVRVNGFPRIAIDNTGGPRNEWIYVSTGEKIIPPATDSADMCLSRSTDNGTTWTHTRINQDTPGNGKLQFMGDIDVAPDGSIVCSYYDQRNTTKPVTEYWMSRSTDGGISWADIPVSDHTFTPSAIQGLTYGYQGDYTGITTAAGKVWPFWADNSSGIYQVWTAGINIIGIKPVGNKIPVEFSLEQNYPNPFNPITKIKFDLAISNFTLSESKGLKVYLIIYDILGREIERFGNEQLDPGIYEVTFDGSNLSSGIFFYKLNVISAENFSIFTQTRKMILIK